MAHSVQFSFLCSWQRACSSYTASQVNPWHHHPSKHPANKFKCFHFLYRHSTFTKQRHAPTCAFLICHLQDGSPPSAPQFQIKAIKVSHVWQLEILERSYTIQMLMPGVTRLKICGAFIERALRHSAKQTEWIYSEPMLNCSMCCVWKSGTLWRIQLPVEKSWLRATEGINFLNS